MANIINLNSGANTYVERSELFNAFMAEIRSIPLLSRTEEEKLLERYKKSDSLEEKRVIRDTLLKHNQRFVVGAAKQFANNDVEVLLELISEANIAFMDAIDSYDPNKAKTKLISWASFYMRRAMNAFLIKNKHIIRQSYDSLTHHQLTKARSILTQREEREVTDEEILDYLSNERKLAVSDVRDVRQIQVNSIDMAFQNEDDFNTVLTDYNVITSSNNESERSLSNDDSKVLLDVAMDILDDREKEIFKMLYGLESRMIEESMGTVAKHFNCSSERIRQIHEKGLKKMRDKLSRYLKYS